MKKLWRLFVAFARVGVMTFGGGYAMIPLIQRETVETRKWITDEDVLEIIAIAESTPGPIAINSATFVGSRVAGTAGPPAPRWASFSPPSSASSSSVSTVSGAGAKESSSAFSGIVPSGVAAQSRSSLLIRLELQIRMLGFIFMV